MELLAELKKEIRRISKRQDLQTDVIVRMLDPHVLFGPEKNISLTS